MTIVTTRLILFFSAHSAIGAVTCGSVKPVRTMNGERVGIMPVAAAMTTIGTLASVATGAAASASGVRPKPGEHAHLVLHDELLRDALGGFGRQSGVVLDDQLDLAPGDRIAVLRDVEPARGFDLLAGRRERAGERRG